MIHSLPALKDGIWQADVPLPDFPPNLATMLNQNADRFGGRAMFEEGGRTLAWADLQAQVARLQSSLGKEGLEPGQRVAILSPNRREMLLLELAVMSMGAVAVPIFPGYSAAQTRELVEFCEPTFVAVASQSQFDKLEETKRFQRVLHFEPLEAAGETNLLGFPGLIEGAGPGRIEGERVATGTVCLMMYTSGTMGKPKCVQLTHGNILSQQAAMRVLWKLDHEDRFLSYLPWHHSFGGIYEKYAALYNGALLALDSGQGKKVEVLLENWARVKPTAFFSVPRIYQQIATKILQDPALEPTVFHDRLRFVFTAAAPLPKSISDLFEQRGIPVYEGWGLTETSPCCTVSDPLVARSPGVVGKPIPGVAIRLAEDGEIQVRGPNVMKGYFHNPEATDAVLLEGGWFATGDLGDFTETGLRLLSRKDRIFKLSNAEKVAPAELENLILDHCCFLSHVYVAGEGQDRPVGLLFPNMAMFEDRPDESRLRPGCRCPKGVKDLSACLSSCLGELMGTLNAKYLRPRAVMLVDHQLSVEGGELTPSMKLAPNRVGRIFKARIEQLYGEGESVDLGDGYLLILERG